MKIINDDGQEMDVPVYCKKCHKEQNELNYALRHIMLRHPFDYAKWNNLKGKPSKLTPELANEIMMEFYTEDLTSI